ncbi:nicotinamide riboside transporter PnuC [Seongchinamella sediminis]|uniref:Nicotinamide riboside transporter PnuC n=1 Tax=Seongchinamella sediminis TaxID=2283635 RepID=A0A3L7E2P5_9GAMM|nr:nicotinamide riboside transporter PnuC [Seongchinamella sediminis]RLQ22653.1 nicotinamide riboside transporter PnuC [Seongchinamella sediminis]
MAINTGIEIFATLAGLLYIVLLIRENISCWPFGIAGSLLSIYLFIDGKLYSEAFLYSYYVIMGAWGWLRWSQRNTAGDNPVVRYRLSAHVIIVLLSSAGALALGSFFSGYTDAQRPYIDAFTTAFSFAATYMEVKKVLETWVYWIVLNLASIWLYMDRSLDIYAALICVYALMSVWGLVQWMRVYRGQQALS